MATVRRCEFCKSKLPDGARTNQKFCDADCRRGRTKTPTVEEIAELGSLTEATEKAIAEAKSKSLLGPLDGGAVAAIRVLARKIDDEAIRWDYCVEWAQHNPGEKGGPKPPTTDNVSLPTYLRYCESLGLTPAGRGRIAGAQPKDGDGVGGSEVDRLADEVPKPNGK